MDAKTYFTISELAHSDTAQMLGIDNTPSKDVADKLHILITECLDPIRERCGFPITVSSGYRCEMLNKKVGGVGTSQHVKGEAADLVGKDSAQTRKIFEAAKSIGNFDQLLYERNRTSGKVWVHISYKKSGNRKQCIDNYTV